MTGLRRIVYLPAVVAAARAGIRTAREFFCVLVPLSADAVPAGSAA
jgi:ABC-type spermidine/putrescine transport system permease subunit I